MIEVEGENFFPAVNAIIKLANCAKKRNSSLKKSLNKQKKFLHQLINTPIKLIILTILLPAKIILFFNFALVNKKSYNFFMDFNSEFESICGLIKLHLPEEEKKELLAQLQKIVNWVSELEKWRAPAGEGAQHSPVQFYAPSREDTVSGSLSREKILETVPRIRREMIEVPSAIKER